MTNIPGNLARVPNTLASNIVLQALQRTQKTLLETQIQLATGRRINRASDDALGTSVVTVLDDVIERRDQRLRNLSNADAVLNNVESALAEATDLLIEAKTVASSQIGVGSDEDTRRNQATVVDALVQELVSLANREYQNIHFFGGNQTANAPMVGLLGGFQYAGQGDGLVTDLGLGSSMAITLSADEAFGNLSSRVQGNFDLDPTLTVDTLLNDLNGARDFGVALGVVDVDVGGTVVQVDLTSANTVGDIASLLETEIQTLDPPATVSVGPDGFVIDLNTVAITISDLTGGSTAADLGLDLLFPTPGPNAGSDINPRLTELTPVANFTGVTIPMGTIRISNGGLSRDLDLSGVTNVQELINAVEALDLGVRVEIAEAGDRLNFVNELSGGDMAIAEVAGGATATELGIRTFASWTELSDFNNGRGVQITTGSVDPVTGLPDPTRDIDFRITMKDNSALDVDLTGAVTVQDVIDIINAAAGIAGAPVTATLAADGNGIALTDASVGVGPTVVTSRNGSFAAEDLGMIGSTAGATLTSEDRATVAVDGMFTHLMSLRDALLSNDERGITFAAEKFEADLDRLSEARADVGIRSRRVSDAVLREEDLKIQDMSLRSEIQDLDYTEASIRFSTLQQQLQAGLLTTQQALSLSLLDFLA